VGCMGCMNVAPLRTLAREGLEAVGESRVRSFGVGHVTAAPREERWKKVRFFETQKKTR